MRTYELKIKDKEYEIKVKSFSLDSAELEVEGETIKVVVDAIGDDMAGKMPSRPLPTKSPAATPAPSGGGAAAPKKSTPSGGAGAVIAPIPGAIMEVFVKEGDHVVAGQPVVKMEAMKMENIINSEIEGNVVSISVNPGDAVGQGDELLAVE
jgi:biotin carboxyl carrier protein